MRRFVFVCLLVVSFSPMRAGAASAGGWTRPVPGAVVRPFDPPRTRFGAGHLGVDLAASPGTPVLAAGSGVVAFAGSVAGTKHVVIAHAGNLRTSYSFLATIAVRRGQTVRAGDVVGTTGGTGEGHDGNVLHFGLRSGDTYLDPMVLLGPPDLTALVHLAPTSEPPHATSLARERRGLLAGLVDDARTAVHIGMAAVDAGAAVVARAFPFETAVGHGVRDWLEQRGHCDAHAPPADGEGGSSHRVMVVAGIESSGSKLHPPLPLPVTALGYRPDEVTYYSYAPDGGDYDARDTEGPLLPAARGLAEQLRAMQRREPGREVDLIAHSQGGVVVEAFLTQLYDRGDPSYPPLGTVVTLSSPLRGAPLASAAKELAATRTGGAALRRVAPFARTPAVRDLAPDSALMHRLDDAALPDQVELTTIGAATDVVVPGNAATRPGARGTTVLPRAVNAHAGIVTDPAALASVRAALEDRSLPCRGLVTTMAGELAPPAISRLEIGLGGAATADARALEWP